MLKIKHLPWGIASIILLVSVAQAGTIHLAPKLSASEEYTDNLFLSGTEPQEEFITVISPGFDYSASLKESGIDISYTAGYTTYQKSDEDPFVSHEASAYFFTNQTRHTQAEFRNFFLNSNEPHLEGEYSLLGFVEYDDQLLPVLDTSLRTGLNEYITDTAIADLTHQFGEENSINLRGLFSLRKEFDPEYSNDNQRYEPSVNLTYWMTPRFGFDISVIYTRADFENSDNFDDWEGLITLRRAVTRHFEIHGGYDHTIRQYSEGTENDYDEYSGNVGFTYRTNDNVSITLGAGYFIQNIEEGTDENGFFFNASIDKSWSTPRYSARIVGSAGLDRNEFGTENLGLERFYGISTTTSYHLTRFLSASFNASGRMSERLNTDDNQTDYIVNAGIGFTYSPKTWLSINTVYSHNLLRGRDERDYDENAATLAVSITPLGFRYQ